MFDFIGKKEYFGWGDSGLPLGEQNGLKGAQDAFILSLLFGRSELKVLEMGGGDSRILRTLCASNECWNIDIFEGRDGGPKGEVSIRKVRNVIGQMGAFSPELPADYFDYVVSISVVEHIPAATLPKVFEDCWRVLKPGGVTAHAIDVYLLDRDQSDHPHQTAVRERLELYQQSARGAGFELIEPCVLGVSPNFCTGYVSNPDGVMFVWNRIAPQLRSLREIAQVASLKAMWRKPE